MAHQCKIPNLGKSIIMATLPILDPLIKWMGEMLLWCFKHVWLMLRLINMSKIGPKIVHSAKCTNSVWCKQFAACHVHGIITSCSSKLLRWDWWLWKAEMSLFNFDVHHLYWFILEVGEKCPWSWDKKSVKHLEIFLSIKSAF